MNNWVIFSRALLVVVRYHKLQGKCRIVRFSGVLTHQQRQVKMQLRPFKGLDRTVSWGQTLALEIMHQVLSSWRFLTEKSRAVLRRGHIILWCNLDILLLIRYCRWILRSSCLRFSELIWPRLMDDGVSTVLGWIPLSPLAFLYIIETFIRRKETKNWKRCLDTLPG